MLKYRGQYRVMYELDKTGRPTEFTYIPCRIYRGANVYRYNQDILCIYLPSTQIFNRLLKEYSDIFKPYLLGSKEGTLFFEESSIEKVSVILKFWTKGRKVSPRSKRNVKYSEKVGLSARKVG